MFRRVSLITFLLILSLFGEIFAEAEQSKFSFGDFRFLFHKQIKGNPVKVTVDNNADGAPDLCIAFVYNNAGRPVNIQLDKACNKKVDSVGLATWSAGGLILSEKWTRSFATQRAECISYNYNDKGQLLRKEWDAGCDDKPDQCDYFAYGESGKLKAKQRRGNILTPVASGCDGKLVQCWTYRYDSMGNIWKKFRDDGCDKSNNSLYNFDHNTKGRRIAERADYDGDGKSDFCFFLDWSKGGDLLKIEGDKNCNLTNDYIQTFFYDDKGRLKRVVDDINGDGEPDSINVFSY